MFRHPQILGFFLLLTVIVSCNNEDSKNSIYDIIGSNIDNINRFIEQQNKDILFAFQAAMEDPKTMEKAKIFLPQVEKIHSLSDSMVLNIVNIKENKIGGELSHPQLTSLYNILTIYRSEILNIDPEILNVFRKSVWVSNLTADTIQQNFQNFEKSFLYAESRNASNALLNTIINNVRLAENKLLNFCNKRMTFHGCFYDKYESLFAQDKTIVQPGETIQIKAAMGYISTSCDTKMTIQNKTLSSDDNGVIKYILKTEKKSGKYVIPVKIEFTDVQGGKNISSRTVEYIVAEK